jgi:hypothetical protein
MEKEEIPSGYRRWLCNMDVRRGLELRGSRQNVSYGQGSAAALVDMKLPGVGKIRHSERGVGWDVDVKRLKRRGLYL